jgi:hypothetical protein
MVAATRLTATLPLAVLVMAAAYSRVRPVLNVEGRPLPPDAESLSLDQIGRTIAGRADSDRSLKRAAARARS